MYIHIHIYIYIIFYISYIIYILSNFCYSWCFWYVALVIIPPSEAWQLFHLRHASITRIDVFSTGDRKVMRCRVHRNDHAQYVCIWMRLMQLVCIMYIIYIYIYIWLYLCVYECVLSVLRCLLVGMTWYTACSLISGSYVRFLCYAVPCYASRWCDIPVHDRIGDRLMGMYFGICACLCTWWGLNWARLVRMVPSIWQRLLKMSIPMYCNERFFRGPAMPHEHRPHHRHHEAYRLAGGCWTW